MAILKGKDGTVKLANVLQDGSAGTSLVSSWNVSIETDTLETTAMGTGGWKTFEGSLQSWTGTVELLFSDDDDSISYDTEAGTPDTTGYINGAAVAVILTDGGGNTYTGSAIVTSATVDVSPADLVTLTLDLTGTGALAIV
jgi:hypothetical protein